jgi:hypothetical protein
MCSVLGAAGAGHPWDLAVVQGTPGIGLVQLHGSPGRVTNDRTGAPRVGIRFIDDRHSVGFERPDGFSEIRHREPKAESAVNGLAFFRQRIEFEDGVADTPGIGLHSM